MTIATELRLFRALVGAVLTIPLVAGGVGALGGLEGLAVLFGTDRNLAVAPGLRNHLRAICWMFFAYVPLLAWTLGDLPSRATPFRIIIGCATLAGFARLLGSFVDGPPGTVPVVFLSMELMLMPGLLFWHARLLRRLREASRAPSGG